MDIRLTVLFSDCGQKGLDEVKSKQCATILVFLLHYTKILYTWWYGKRRFSDLLNEWILMYVVEDMTIESTIAVTRFACDLVRCKGACCTMPGPNGAPLQDQETEEIRSAFPIVRKYLSNEHIECIEKEGLFQRSTVGATTTCYENHACVFVTYDGAIAKCAFERAYFNREISWRKPLSCHLFPIRVDHGFQLHLRYESIPECDPALELGRTNRVLLTDFLGESLKRAFGKQWYSEFANESKDERMRLMDEQPGRKIS
jgi:hypothetical protein